MNIYRIIGILLLVYLLPLNSFSQVDREFWFSIPKETSGHSSIDATNNASFKITAMSLPANVTISMPANSGFTTRTFTVPAGQTHVEVMATSFAAFATIYSNTAASASPATTGQTNRGILITSDNDITVYYDYDNVNNRDLFALKGSNALGTDFYVPFQTIATWGLDAYNPNAMATIEIVATEDNTILTITPTITFIGCSSSPFTITLNRGETYTMASETYLTRGAGTRIQSNHKIVVTTNDDSVRGAAANCYDLIGDQLVPTDVIGSEYVVMPGNGANPGTSTAPLYQNDLIGDQIFVVATQPSTKIYFYGKTGTLFKTITLNAGKSDYFSIDISNTEMASMYVTSKDASKPFYVLHTTGIKCELGGAIIPPITDCTGSSEVSFYRSSSVDSITVNLMIPYDPTLLFTDTNQSHYKFSLITYDAAGNIASTFAIPGTWFEPNILSGWATLKMTNRSFHKYTTKGRAHKVTNTQDFFHLGMTNGTSGSTNKYGYFSSFNAAQAEVYIPQSQEKSYAACYGTPINLVVSGGLSYTWHYGSPSGSPTYLSDSKSATPAVSGLPVGTHVFYVEVQQSKCFGIDTLKAIVTILPVVTAAFEVDNNYICSPDTVHFINKSLNADVYTWRKQIGSAAAYDMTFTAPNTEMKFAEYLNNPSTTTPQYIKYKLIAESTAGCADIDSIILPVYPRIEAVFKPSPDTIGCHPLPVHFRNISGGNTKYNFWNYGDQQSSVDSVLANPIHTFTNFSLKDTAYTVTLITKSPFYCTDTARSKVIVHPYIFANYAVDTVRGCSPLQLKIQNGSMGAISKYKWEYGNGTTSGRSDASYTYTYTNTGSIDSTRRLTLSVYNAAGCIDSLSRLITTYPEIHTKFTASPDTGCTPLKVTYNNLSNSAANTFYWNFGDGNYTYDKNPIHEYVNPSVNDTTYKVKLMATTSQHCPAYDSTNILVRGFIQPNFAIDTSASCAPFYIKIQNSSIHSPTAVLSWNFGDSAKDSVTSATSIIHQYHNTTTLPLNLNIRLNLLGSGGCSKVLTRPIIVYPEITADFEPDTVGCDPLPITFRNLSTNQVAQSFIWNFGDSASSTETNPYHLFHHLESTDQTYPVKLIAQSEFNCRDTITKLVKVYAYIDSRFTVDKGFGCSPLTVAITDSSSGGIVLRNWGGTPVVANKTVYLNNTDKVMVKDLTLTVSNGHCIKTFTRPITIYPQVSAQYTVSDVLGCTPFKVDFEHIWDKRYIITKYKWEFGDNSSSSDNTFTTHSYTNILPDTIDYITKLVVYSEYNCVDSMEKTIQVYPFIKADFSVDDAEGCSPHTVNITNASSDGSNNFTWIYDDGSPLDYTNAKLHSHIYNNPDPTTRTFQLKLLASYNGNCQKVATQDINVYPVVTAKFTEDTLKGCHPLEINYTNQSSNANSYKWYYGDKGTDVFTDPTHTYSNYSTIDSIYTVTLVATSEFNCFDKTSKKVVVYPKPKAIVYVNSAIECPPFLVPIDNKSEAGDTFYWTFGDGNSLTTYNTNLISHVYYNTTNDIASYDLGLLVKTIHGCSETTSQPINVYPAVLADFTPDTAGCSPVIVPFVNKTIRGYKYLWDFNDGNINKYESPTYQFYNTSIYDTTFHVSMIATSKFDCLDTAYRDVLVYPQPEARFMALPSHMTFPVATVTLTNQTNAGFWSYLWNFDDGNTTTVRDPLPYTYNHWGNYIISLKAYSNHCEDTTSQRIRIFPAKPVAGFYASDNGCVPLSVHFTDTSKYALTWYWQFDDGGTSTEQNPDYVYQTAGKYNVKLTITGDGGTDYTYQEVNVYPKPVVDFTYNPTLVMLPDSSGAANNKNRGWVQYTNLSKYGSKFLWYFGDGSQSSEENPRHQYSEIGLFDITLNVWSEHGCFDSLTYPKVINVIVRKDIIFPNAFTPNLLGGNGGKYTSSDIDNDVFHPTWAGIVKFHMEIYDRWGEKLFETDDVNVGWDGYYKGKLCKSDVYVCKANGNYADGSDFNYVGDLTLIR